MHVCSRTVLEDVCAFVCVQEVAQADSVGNGQTREICLWLVSSVHLT
jgi:hypothetical protein